MLKYTQSSKHGLPDSTLISQTWGISPPVLRVKVYFFSSQICGPSRSNFLCEFFFWNEILFLKITLKLCQVRYNTYMCDWIQKRRIVSSSKQSFLTITQVLCPPSSFRKKLYAWGSRKNHLTERKVCHKNVQLVIERKGGREEEKKRGRKEGKREGREGRRGVGGREKKEARRQRERQNRKERESHSFCLYSIRLSSVRTDKPCATFNSTFFLNYWAYIDAVNSLPSILWM